MLPQDDDDSYIAESNGRAGAETDAQRAEYLHLWDQIVILVSLIGFIVMYLLKSL